MKQKVVTKVTLKGQKCQSKALKTIASLVGVDSAAFKEGDKSQIEVTGEIDAVKLITMLRKKVGYAEIVSVSAVDDKKDDKKDKTEEISFPYYVHNHPMPYYVCEPARDPPCSVV